MSSIDPCEEGETQLFIANSVEVRSDEICAESVLSVDGMVQESKAVKLDAVDKSPSMHTVVCNQKDSVTAANSNHSCNRRHSRSQKSHDATSSGDAAAAGFQHKSTSCHSDAEADANDKHAHSIQKHVVHHLDTGDNNSADFPLKQNDVLKSPLRV